MTNLFEKLIAHLEKKHNKKLSKEEIHALLSSMGVGLLQEFEEMRKEEANNDRSKRRSK